MKVVYNEIDRFAAQWLRNLAAAGEIPQGEVDERSIKELRGADLAGVRQFHTFAGIGGWSLALKLAGWPEDREVWTGSCPCQPFSTAGKGAGVKDERHLWPDFFRLIAECRPATVFGEQVAGAAGVAWLDGIQGDLEGEGYACGAVIVGAHSVGAPHIRQRIYWVADDARAPRIGAERPGYSGVNPRGGGEVDGLGNAAEPARERDPRDVLGAEEEVNRQDGAEHGTGPVRPEYASPLGLWNPASNGREQRRPESRWWGPASRRGSDGKARRIEPGIEPLAHGIPRRMDKLRGYGNAIVPPLAAEFIAAYMEAAGIDPTPTQEKKNG